MTNGTNKEWYKHGFGLAVAIIFFPIFLIWYAWAKSSWNKGLKWTVSIVMGLFILMGIGVAMTPTEPTTTPAPSPAVASTVPVATPASPSPTENELDASVRFNELAFQITNNESRIWNGCKFEINPGILKSGYIYRVESFPANDAIIIPFKEFTKGDGTRFNNYETKAQSISIYCTDVEGQSGHAYYSIK
jgi:hypothetical protein